jgi:type II secretory pathway component GspD/PulD (secretin)
MTTRIKKGLIALLALAFTLAVVMPALAEDPVPAAGQNQEGAGKAAQDQASEMQKTRDVMQNLRKEIVKLKYVRAQDIQNILYAYVSQYGHISFNPNMSSVLSISDTPENVDKILAAIREIDVKPADVLYTVQLVLGSETDAATDAELKNDPIIKELGKLLRFKGYTLLDATLVRSVNLDNSKVQFGPKAEFQLQLRPEVTGDAKAPVIKSEVRLQQTLKRVNSNFTKADGSEAAAAAITTVNVTLIESTLNIKSGERTVVGVSKLDGGDKGLILIISAKIID